MSRPAAWRLEPAAYPVTDVVGTRYQDLDPNGHLNNVAIAALFECARVQLSGHVGPWAERPADERTIVASVAIAYLREGAFPAPVTIGSGIGRIGTSSWTVEQAMFQAGACIATCDTAVAYRTGDRAQPLGAEMRAALETRMTGGDPEA